MISNWFRYLGMTPSTDSLVTGVIVGAMITAATDLGWGLLTFGVIYGGAKLYYKF